MKRNKKLESIVEKDLSKYRDDDFLSVLKDRVNRKTEARKRKMPVCGIVSAVATAVVVVVAIVLVFTLLPATKNDNMPHAPSSDPINKSLINEVNMFVQNIQFNDVENNKVTKYPNNDTEKPYYQVTSDNVTIDVYSGDCELEYERIYSEKTTVSGYDLNYFGQTFLQDNDEYVAISGYIDTGTELLLLEYAKLLEDANNTEFIELESLNLVNILSGIIVSKEASKQ